MDSEVWETTSRWNLSVASRTKDLRQPWWPDLRDPTVQVPIGGPWRKKLRKSGTSRALASITLVYKITNKIMPKTMWLCDDVMNLAWTFRCYNCGDLAQHIASKCNLGPQPKRCHNCKSSDHLIADCPKRTTNKENTVNNKKDKVTTNHPSILWVHDLTVTLLWLYYYAYFFQDDPQHQDIYSTDDMNSENSSIDINLNMSASPNSVSNGSTGDFS